ncbi:MAG TPA: MYXO-CTERM sorting domain-containing protein [Myxococcota bacterium]
MAVRATRQGASFYVDNDDDARPEGSTRCIDVFAVDAAGNESAPLPVCVPLIDRDKEDCAQSSPSSFGLLGLALLLVRRRR